MNDFLTIENIFNIDDYLEKNKISKMDLIKKAQSGEAELLIYITQITGHAESKIKDISYLYLSNVTGYCKLTEKYFNVISNNHEIILRYPLEATKYCKILLSIEISRKENEEKLMENYFKTQSEKRWDKYKKNNLFTPSSTIDKKDIRFNELYDLKKCDFETDGKNRSSIYFYAIPIKQIIVKETLKGLKK